MPAPADLMKLIAGGAGKSAAPPPMPGGGSPQGAPLGGAPMSTPQPAEGEKMNAMATIHIATRLLEQTLTALGSESEEGQTVLDVLGKLAKKFGHSKEKAQELVPAELMQLMQSMPGLGGMPGAGGPPPGAPPGAPGGGAPGGGMPQMPMAA